MHQHVLQAMERILTLASLACQESVLHGLGHWQRQYPAQVNTIIDRFLGSSVDLDARLVIYAKSAHSGRVL
jgi:hypothetical protein